MAELATLARPYAAAAFEIAKDENRLELWSNHLARLTAALENSEVAQVISSPVHTPPRKALILNDLFGDEATESIRRFVNVLADNRRLELLPEIQDEFEVRLAEENESLEVEITSAVELTEDELATFREVLTRRFDRRIEMSAVVDEAVLGGAMIRAGDTVVDSTVRGKLEKLRTTLTRV